MRTHHRRRGATALLIASSLLGAGLAFTTPAHADDDVTLNLIGINDFHGRIDENTVKFAGTVEEVRQEGGDDDSLLISAGDNVSASLFASAVQGDIPTIDVLNALDLDASAVGNHEFDKGYADLEDRLAPAADFPFLGANVYKSDGTRALDPCKIFTVDGLRVAVVGAVTQETKALVSPAGIKGLTFGDPAQGINDAVTELKALADPPDVIIASYHEGAPDGTQTYAQNVEHSAVFKHLAEDTSPDVDAIFMGHTHQAYTYDAPVPGEPGKTRPLIQTGSYGANVGNIKLTVDADTGDVVSYTQKNVARTTEADATLTGEFPRVAAVKPIVDSALAYAKTVGDTKIGTITQDITTAYTGTSRDDRASESTLGDLVADALLSKVADTSAGADLGVVNPGGLRAELTYAGSTASNPANTDGVVTYAEANSVLPFVNQLDTVSLKGSSLKKVLEQQWQRDDAGNVPTRPYLALGLSKNVHFTADPSRPEGDRITSVTIDGAPLDPAKTYKVATFSFLATGGDNFRAFTEGSAVDTGLVDYQAWIDYLGKHSPVHPDFARRGVTVQGVATSYPTGGHVSLTLPKLDLTSLGSPKNVSVTGTLKAGGSTRDLGAFPVTNGASTVAFDLPSGVIGDATLTLEAYPSGTTATVPLRIGKADATVTASVPETAKTGTAFPVQVTVDSDSGVDPTGTVSVLDGDTVLASGSLTDATATLSVRAAKLGVGSHALTVSYSGDTLHDAAQADTDPVEVVKGGSGFGAVTSTTAYGTSPVITVAADEDASGLVYVTHDGDVVGIGTMQDGAGTVTLGKTVLVPGSYDLEVFYGGSEQFDPTDTSVSLTVTKAVASVAKTSLTSPIVKNRTAAKLGVKVSAAGVTPTGRVSVYWGTKLVGTTTLSGGKATVTLKKFTSSGSLHLTVKYAGSATVAPSQTTYTIKVAAK